MVGPSDETQRYFKAEDIAEALSEARAECYREPNTNLWRSFWDRLTQGGPIPADPLNATNAGQQEML